MQIKYVRDIFKLSRKEKNAVLASIQYALSIFAHTHYELLVSIQFTTDCSVSLPPEWIHCTIYMDGNTRLPSMLGMLYYSGHRFLKD